jgi:hypothetical protein
LMNRENKIYLNYFDNLKFREELINFDLINFHKDKDVIIIKVNHQWHENISRNLKLHSKIKSIGYEPSKFKLKYLFNEW